MTWKILLGLLVTIAIATPLPFDNDKDLTMDSASGMGDDNKEGKMEEVPMHEETNNRPEERPQFCSVPYNYTIIYDVHVRVDGKLQRQQVTEVRHTVKCCEGYERIRRRCHLIDLCQDRICPEDPQSKCVTVQRCKKQFPVFVTGSGHVSDVCTQPEETRIHLNACTNSTGICKKESQCPGSEVAVCFGNKCDCTAGPLWLLPNGKEAGCSA